MPSVGDTIQVEVSGGTVSGAGGGVYIGGGASMSLPALIIEDRGETWLIRLSIGGGDENLIEIPKE
jgi:hypothetical protein